MITHHPIPSSWSTSEVFDTLISFSLKKKIFFFCPKFEAKNKDSWSLLLQVYLRLLKHTSSFHCCQVHREAITSGNKRTRVSQVNALIRSLREDWQRSSYKAIKLSLGDRFLYVLSDNTFGNTMNRFYLSTFWILVGHSEPPRWFAGFPFHFLGRSTSMSYWERLEWEFFLCGQDSRT